MRRQPCCVLFMPIMNKCIAVWGGLEVLVYLSLHAKTVTMLHAIDQSVYNSGFSLME